LITMKNPNTVIHKYERRYDIDWLRVLGMLMIFIFHCARFFNEGDWHVKNNQLYESVDVFVSVVSQWIMPLFFILSAVSSYYALNFRKAGQFIGERLRRLVIPFLFGTLIVLIPVQVYIERVSHLQYDGSFFEFYPHYFDGFYAFGGNFAWMGLHLWYLEMLFIFSLITLPFFLYLRGKKRGNFISRTATFFNKPCAIFLLAVPIAIMELLVNMDPEGAGRRDFGGWSFMTYLVFFILGYLIASHLKFKQSVERQRTTALVVGVTSTILGYFLLESGYSSYGFLFSLLRAVNSWAWLLAFLGFGSKYFTFNNSILKYANAAVLPFYILHQTVIVAIGFYIAHWDASLIVKFSILSTSSFVIILATYDLLIKRIKGLRFLFGMKSKE
jgi:glucan biosynthesis protein C